LRVNWWVQTHYRFSASLVRDSIVWGSSPQGLVQIIIQSNLANYYLRDQKKRVGCGY